MKKQKLIIGIDLTNEYCQACYYSYKHKQPESVATGSAAARYTFPVAISYSSEREEWVIGGEAIHNGEAFSCRVYDNLLKGLFAGAVAEIGGKSYGYEKLLAVFFGKLLELIQIRSGLMAIESINLTLKTVDAASKRALASVFEALGIEESKITFLNNAECFAYYTLNEDEKLWSDGALLFDFGKEGFFEKRLTVSGSRSEPLFYIGEKDYSPDFSVKDLGSELLREQLDARLLEIYRRSGIEGENTSVYFAGEGFSEYWFSKTLEEISKTRRAFKGNNIYVKGACLAGVIRFYNGGKDYPIICRGRTRASISVTAKGAYEEEIELSGAAKDWYDASGETVLMLEGEKKAEVSVRSLSSGERSVLDFDLSDFPDRERGTTRVLVRVHYINENECEISMKDLGFGAFYPPSGVEVIKRLDLGGYI